MFHVGLSFQLGDLLWRLLSFRIILFLLLANLSRILFCLLLCRCILQNVGRWASVPWDGATLDLAGFLQLSDLRDQVRPRTVSLQPLHRDLAPFPAIFKILFSKRHVATQFLFNECHYWSVRLVLELFQAQRHKR